MYTFWTTVTVAPKSAKMVPHNGPGAKPIISITLMPLSAIAYQLPEIKKKYI